LLLFSESAKCYWAVYQQNCYWAVYQ
jgi:hypothetical protein